MPEKPRDYEAELHQPPTPTFHLESWTRFTLVAPHYVDMHFRCRPRQHAFRFGTIADIGGGRGHLLQAPVQLPQGPPF